MSRVRALPRRSKVLSRISACTGLMSAARSTTLATVRMISALMSTRSASRSGGRAKSLRRMDERDKPPWCWRQPVGCFRYGYGKAIVVLPRGDDQPVRLYRWASRCASSVCVALVQPGEQVVQRLRQQRVREDAVTQRGIRQPAHHGDFQHGDDLPALGAEHRCAEDLPGIRIDYRFHEAARLARLTRPRHTAHRDRKSTRLNSSHVK